ncbi:MAG: type IV secretion system DNA-binding domain-containing protein [Bryobacteraceae bacterium]|nr:type IV secretion system DNA-binding domain-containing protein [Bryobacteraceae bacterium]
MKREEEITYLARLNFRNDRRLFGIRRSDRRFHMYMMGRTGTGKSTLLETLVRQDIRNGEGLALFDPHGDLVERVVGYASKWRGKDLLYFNVPRPDQPFRFNPLQSVPPSRRPLATAGLLDVFKKLWTDFWGPRTEHILRNALLALLDQPSATLADILRLLGEKTFRETAAARVESPQVRRFWMEEYTKYSPAFRSQAIAPIQNKVGAFLADPILNRILSEPSGTIDLRESMDRGKVLLVNLAKGKIGEDSASLLGAMLVSQLGVAGLSRADMPEGSRPDFYLYLDEFQTFSTLSLANMLSELRKYHVDLILANQYLSQVESEVTDAILGNVGTLIAFRLGPSDATFLSKEFQPTFDAQDLVNLPNHSIYLKLMIDGAVSKPFSADTVKSEELDA